MSITKLKFTSLDSNSVVVTKEDGSSYTAPWPCYTWHAQEIQSAIDSGMSVELWKTEEEVLAEAKESVWEQIKTERDRRILEGGYHISMNDGIVKWFHSDVKSRTQYLTIVNTGVTNPTLTIENWKTMDGSFVTITVDLANSLLLHAITQEAAIFAAAEQHKASAFELADPSTYDFSTGWPLVYGE